MIESSLQRYKAVLSNWRLLIAGLPSAFRMPPVRALVWVPVHFLGANWAKAIGGSHRSAMDQHCAARRHGVRRIHQWMGFGQALQLARYAAIVLYMALAAITALYMYTIPTTDVYQGLAVCSCAASSFMARNRRSGRYVPIWSGISGPERRSA